METSEYGQLLLPLAEGTQKCVLDTTGSFAIKVKTLIPLACRLASPAARGPKKNLVLLLTFLPLIGRMQTRSLWIGS